MQLTTIYRQINNIENKLFIVINKKQKINDEDIEIRIYCNIHILLHKNVQPIKQLLI